MYIYNRLIKLFYDEIKHDPAFSFSFIYINYLYHYHSLKRSHVKTSKTVSTFVHGIYP
jgi:hypothetical protein